MAAEQDWYLLECGHYIHHPKHRPNDIALVQVPESVTCAICPPVKKNKKKRPTRLVVTRVNTL